MKKLFVIIGMVLISLTVFGQKKIKTAESSENIGNGTNNALVITIYEASASDVEKEWKSLMKDFGAKIFSKKEIFADNASIKMIVPNAIDVYARVEDNKDGSLKMIVAFDLEGIFLSSSQHPDQFKEAKKIVYDFAVNATKNAIGNQLKDAERELKKLEKEQTSLVKEKEGLQKDIVSYKEKIIKAEEDIVKNNAAQEAKKKEIAGQIKMVGDIGNKLNTVE